jgi:hypothetical protein
VARNPAEHRVVAFDPGERTGWCLAAIDPDFDPKTGHGFRIEDQGVWTVRETADGLKGLIGRSSAVAYETWRLYASHAKLMIGNDMQPSQVVGMIRYVAWELKRPITNNGADVKGPAMATMPIWLRKHMDKSTEQHDKDAIMHAWYYAWRRYYAKDR